MSTKYRSWTYYHWGVIHIGVDAPEQMSDILYSVRFSGHGLLGKVVDWRLP